MIWKIYHHKSPSNWELVWLWSIPRRNASNAVDSQPAYTTTLFKNPWEKRIIQKWGSGCPGISLFSAKLRQLVARRDCCANMITNLRKPKSQWSRILWYVSIHRWPSLESRRIEYPVTCRGRRRCDGKFNGNGWEWIKLKIPRDSGQRANVKTPLRLSASSASRRTKEPFKDQWKGNYRGKKHTHKENSR